MSNRAADGISVLTMASTDESTPLMKQFWELKAQAGDALLLFRMGDFYELFGDDAVTASQILEITLTSRDKNKPNPMPMAGVPHHSFHGYLQRLLKAGKKVAIADQMEEPQAGKSIVRREIVRTFTPGIQFDLDSSEASFLATAAPVDSKSQPAWILVCLDVATGEVLLSDPIGSERLIDECESLPIRHFLRIGHKLPPELKLRLESSGRCLVEDLPENYLSRDQAGELIRSHYGLATLDSFFSSNSAVHALGISLTYVLRTQKRDRLAHLRLPAPLRKKDALVLGPRSAQHLDLVPAGPNGSDGSPNVFHWLNRTRSALGARELRRWLIEPLVAIPGIRARQEAVLELGKNPFAREGLSQSLSRIYDLERISGRIQAGLANPRDTLALGQSLSALLDFEPFLRPLQSSLLKNISAELSRIQGLIQPLFERITRTQREDAPFAARDGGIFKKGTDPELDRLIDLTENGQRWLVELEARERDSTGIPSLKVKYNRVFGYFIEVTQSHLKNVPAHYQRKQTTVGAERFFTEELKRFEEEIVTASTRQQKLEIALFEELLSAAAAKTPLVMEAANLIARLDCLVALSALVSEPGYCFPMIDESLDLEIEAGRHPLVDHATRGKFVPNDLRLSPQDRMVLLITGPNMGGKSTIMRQAALIVILGQMGAPVPARSARWGAVTSIYTRIGAHDAIARGQSTFMVEMSELAHLLHHAEKRSLLVLDEIGRGTSTYDGISVAWATLEWIAAHSQSRTLFATHYHELTRLSESLPLLANAHMAVESSAASARGESSAKLRFLYLLKEGPANESFGIHVARIAGLPDGVIKRAWQVLEKLEAQAPAQSANPDQLSLFGSASHAPAAIPTEPHPVIREIETVNLSEMTPLQALNFLAKLQDSARESPEQSA